MNEKSTQQEYEIDLLTWRKPCGPTLLPLYLLRLCAPVSRLAIPSF